MFGGFGDADDVEGAGGLPIRLQRPVKQPGPERAVQFRARRAETGHPVTLIALGPPTNIARLFRDYPGSARSIERVVLMGGAIDVPGNVTPLAEFNVWSDPEATALVLRAGVPVTLIGSDV